MLIDRAFIYSTASKAELKWNKNLSWSFLELLEGGGGRGGNCNIIFFKWRISYLSSTFLLVLFIKFIIVYIIVDQFANIKGERILEHINGTWVDEVMSVHIKMVCMSAVATIQKPLKL